MPAVVATGRRGRAVASSSRPPRVCEPCYKRKVSCDLVRPTCGACERFQRTHPEHRCSYSARAVPPSEPRPSPAPFDSQDYLPRFRSGSRALEALLKATGATPDDKPEQQETEPASAEAPAASEEPSGDLTNRMASTSLSPPGPPGERRFELPPAIEQVGFQPRVFPTFPQTLPATHQPHLLQHNAHSVPSVSPSHSHYHLPSAPSNLVPFAHGFVPPSHYHHPVPGASYSGTSRYGDLHDAYDDPLAEEEEEEEDGSAVAFDPLAQRTQACVSPRDIVAGPSYSTHDYRFPPQQAFPPVARPGEALSYRSPAPISEASAQAANAIAGPAFPRWFRLPDPFVPGEGHRGANIGPAPVEHPGGGSENFDEAAMPTHFPGGHSWP